MFLVCRQLKTKQFLPIPVQRSLRRDPFMRKQEDSRFYKTQAAAKTASSDTITTNSPRESARQSVAFGLPGATLLFLASYNCD